ncbi:MAG TPA: D-glycerate dehydrogenase [Edaphocola sp.]|nr:D-glycerate dehydrogenase [Edaphocola sp.]
MKIFCTRKIADRGLDKLRAMGHEVSYWDKKEVMDTETLIAACRDVQALVVADRNRLREDFLRACSHLKIIALHSAGYNHVDIATAKELGILVSNTGSIGCKETADTAFMLMLAVSKKAFYNHRKILEGEWGHFEPAENLGISLRGKTLGVFGMGNIGMEMARLCQAAYGMSVIYHNRHLNHRAEESMDVSWVSFEQLLARSDVISVHAGLNPESENKFNEQAFAQMRAQAIFINTARGGIHDEAALTEALKSGRIWGAGLDVAHPEPMHPGNPLLSLPNVAVTPHIGNAIDTARVAMSVCVAENIIAAAGGSPVPNPVS